MSLSIGAIRLNESRITKIHEGNEAEALYMGRWDRFKEIFRKIRYGATKKAALRIAYNNFNKSVGIDKFKAMLKMRECVDFEDRNKFKVKLIKDNTNPEDIRYSVRYTVDLWTSRELHAVTSAEYKTIKSYLNDEDDTIKDEVKTDELEKDVWRHVFSEIREDFNVYNKKNREHSKTLIDTDVYKIDNEIAMNKLLKTNTNKYKHSRAHIIQQSYRSHLGKLKLSGLSMGKIKEEITQGKVENLQHLRENKNYKLCLPKDQYQIALFFLATKNKVNKVIDIQQVFRSFSMEKKFQNTLKAQFTLDKIGQFENLEELKNSEKSDFGKLSESNQNEVLSKTNALEYFEEQKKCLEICKRLIDEDRFDPASNSIDFYIPSTWTENVLKLYYDQHCKKQEKIINDVVGAFYCNTLPSEKWCKESMEGLSPKYRLECIEELNQYKVDREKILQQFNGELFAKSSQNDINTLVNKEFELPVACKGFKNLILTNMDKKSILDKYNKYESKCRENYGNLLAQIAGNSLTTLGKLEELNQYKQLPLRWQSKLKSLLQVHMDSRSGVGQEMLFMRLKEQFKNIINLAELDPNDVVQLLPENHDRLIKEFAKYQLICNVQGIVSGIRSRFDISKMDKKNSCIIDKEDIVSMKERVPSNTSFEGELYSKSIWSDKEKRRDKVMDPIYWKLYSPSWQSIVKDKYFNNDQIFQIDGNWVNMDYTNLQCNISAFKNAEGVVDDNNRFNLDIFMPVEFNLKGTPYSLNLKITGGIIIDVILDKNKQMLKCIMNFQKPRYNFENLRSITK
jgi:hypothetical protein